MLYFGLYKNLNEIATGTNLKEIVFKLIQKASSEGWVEKLIDAAHSANPENPKLKDIVNSGNKPQNRNEQSSTKYVTRLVITLDGIDAEEFISNKKIREAFLSLAQEASGDASVDFKKIEEGSIKITLSGTPEGLEKLAALIQSRELGELRELEKLGLSIKDAKLVVESDTEEDELATETSEPRSTNIRNNPITIKQILANLIRDNLFGAFWIFRNFFSADPRRPNLIDDEQLQKEIPNPTKSETKFDKKQHLIRKIINQHTKKRDLRGADLSDADLSGADLSGANLRRTNLSGANLSGANLSGANLSGANLSGANLSGANLNNTIIDLKTKLDNKWHLVWQIVNQESENLTFSGAYPIGINLSGANLSGANLRDTDLRDTDLRGTDLSHADLSGAKLSGAYLISADLSGANLSGANLRRANLSGANLSLANFSGANLSLACISGTNLSGANLINANLISADLGNGANLSGANLSGANLSGANFRSFNLSDADLSGANVENARFGNNRGISKEMKVDLIRRGAIFEDNSGDREAVIIPR